jgi:hypothetical protein
MIEESQEEVCTEGHKERRRPRGIVWGGGKGISEPGIAAVL